MEYIDTQHWTDGLRCRQLNEIKGGKGSESEESYRTRKDRERTLASYLDDTAYLVPPPPPLSGPVEPQRNMSLVAWRADTMKTVKTDDLKRALKTTAVPKTKRIPKESSRATKDSNRYCTRRIVRVDTGEIFESPIEAARSLGKQSGGVIRTSCRSNGEILGFQLQWVYEGDTPAAVGRNKVAGGRRLPIAVENVDTGIVYPSYRAAAIAAGTTTNTLFYRINTGNGTFNGCRYRVVNEVHTEPSTEVGSESCQPSSLSDA